MSDPQASPIPSDLTERELKIFSALDDFEHRLNSLEDLALSSQEIVDRRSREMVDQVREFLTSLPPRSEESTTPTTDNNGVLMSEQENTLQNMPAPSRTPFNTKKALAYGGAFAAGVTVGVVVNRTMTKRREAAALAAQAAGSTK